MTRMIERWFPCKEVSENSPAGWGSGNAEKGLFTWFAARPTAQAKAAVICSLLDWPDDKNEQQRLQRLVLRAMTGRNAARDEIIAEINRANPNGASVLDPFSGRGIIPLEAARLGIESHAIDYAPVAVLASHLLTDYPFRDWTGEPELPFGPHGSGTIPTEEGSNERLLRDARTVLTEIGLRHRAAMADFYPTVDGKQPWGYLWAVTIPCQECGRRFPLVGSYNLRLPSTKKGKRGAAAVHDPGQSYYIDADPRSGSFAALVHEGPPRRTPTLTNATGVGGTKVKGKSAICPFSDCGHVHPLEVHKRLASEGKGKDSLLVVADLDEFVGKSFRVPTGHEMEAAAAASNSLGAEKPFTPLLPAVPNEQIPEKSGATIRPQLYGAKTYGDLMIDRQTLSFVRLAKVINAVGKDLRAEGVSDGYVRFLLGFAGAQVVRQIKYSTRGATLQIKPSGAVMTNHIFVNESTIAFSYDNFEAGLGAGPGTWDSMVAGGLSTLKGLLQGSSGRPTDVIHGSATSQPYGSKSMAAVVTDPPYDAMVYYSDSSDLMYAWLKRALVSMYPELALTDDPRGLQDKSEEIIVMDHNKTPGEHRTREHYDRLISQAFAEMRRVVRDDGVVTIVFGHGDPEVWQRLLGAISGAGLVMTGSWPANTEAGGQQGKANIETTLTMACRPAAPNRPVGTKTQVEAEVKAEVVGRIPMWEDSGLAPTDMLMASAGPAMEVVGRYSQVLDILGEPVDPSTFLVTARRAVQDYSRMEIDHHPLETFDARTRFALWWVQLFRKDETAKSELRWQTLAAELDLPAVRDLMQEGKGVRFGDAKSFKGTITSESAVIDVALAAAKAWDLGMGAVGEVLAESKREGDPYLWATIKFLSERLPESDPDAVVWTKLVRNKSLVVNAAQGAADAAAEASLASARAGKQRSLFESAEAE